MSIVPSAVRIQSARIYLASRDNNKWLEFAVNLTAQSGLRIALGIASHGLTEVLQHASGAISAGTQFFATRFADYVFPIPRHGQFQKTINAAIIGFSHLVHNFETSLSDVKQATLLKDYKEEFERCWKSSDEVEDVKKAELYIRLDEVDGEKPSVGKMVKKLFKNS